MRTEEILKNIYENGGFDNFCHWNYKEIITWVQSHYCCSRYVANRVAIQLM